MDMENLTPAQNELIDYLQDEIANSQLPPAELAAKKANEEQEELRLIDADVMQWNMDASDTYIYHHDRMYQMLKYEVTDTELTIRYTHLQLSRARYNKQQLEQYLDQCYYDEWIIHRNESQELWLSHIGQTITDLNVLRDVEELLEAMTKRRKPLLFVGQL